jgi:DNA-binding IclR family transcriptional regulator
MVGSEDCVADGVDMDGRNGPMRGGAPAVARAVAVLRLLARSDEPLGVQAVARAVGLVPSTALHILRALAGEELVAVDPETRRYSLDAGILTLAGQWLGRNPFATRAQAMLQALARRHGVTAIGVQVRDLDHILVVAIAQAERRLQLHAEIGSRFPALISATGRCIAAFGDHPWAEIETRFRALRWDRPPPLDTWRAEVAATARNGYALDVGHYMAGVTVVSAPVFDRAARMTHAVVAVGTTDHIEDIGRDALIAGAKDAARRLSAAGETGAGSN